jgi:hypothetical protein
LFLGASTDFEDAGDPAGTWTFDFYESHDDGADGFPDAAWDVLSFAFYDYIPPQPSDWPGDVEGFETGVPPLGDWLASGAHSGDESWHQRTASPHEGRAYASVQHDPDLIRQDEWLISPEAVAAPGMTLSGATMGSIYWGTPASQGGSYDNYDLEVWLLGEGGNDAFVGLLDDSWVSSYAWEEFLFDLDGFVTLGETFRVGFRYHGLDGAEGSIDAVLLTPEPAGLLLWALGGLAAARRWR